MSATSGIDHPTRSTAGEDDGIDHIGADTPRSGVATPQPDLHDKRLPGIMSYFQVRVASIKSLLPGSFASSSRPPSTSSKSSSTAKLPPSSAVSSSSSAATPAPSSPRASSTHLAAAAGPVTASAFASASAPAPDASVLPLDPPLAPTPTPHPSSESPTLNQALGAGDARTALAAPTLPQIQSELPPPAQPLAYTSSPAIPKPLVLSEPDQPRNAAAKTPKTPTDTHAPMPILSAQSTQTMRPSPLSQMKTVGSNPPSRHDELANGQVSPTSTLPLPPAGAPLAASHSAQSQPAIALPPATGTTPAMPSTLPSTSHPYPTPPGSLRGAGSEHTSSNRHEDGHGSGLGSGHGTGDAPKETATIVNNKVRKGGAGGAVDRAESGAAAGSTPDRERWNASWNFGHKKSISDAMDVHSRPDSPSHPNAPLAGVVTPSSVLARHFSVPSIPQINSALSQSSTPTSSTPASLRSPTKPVGGSRKASTAPDTPVRPGSPSTDAHAGAGAGAGAAASFSRSKSASHLRKLTPMIMVKKSGHTTPTRSMSTAHSQTATPRMSMAAPSEYGSGQATPMSSRSRAPSVAPAGAAPAPKGKLTIKIAEARGLRQTRDPYVVVVFQRSELISGGPRPAEGGDSEAIAPGHALTSIPIQRQPSDNGRPVSIPMRSRQSSNTSITDFGGLRKSGRRSLTNPKWDAEAIFDVVDSDMLVDISVYDLSPAGEEFLGHVDIQANSSEKNGAVRGWFPLRGHADTVAEQAPTGEIYVEAFYQRTEKRHYGPDDFEILRLIGKGTFGQVYQVRKKDTRRIYAMKVLSKKKIVQKKEVAHTVGERNILVRTATTESPFIVGLKFSFQTPSDLYLVTDYMSGGELFWHLQKEGRFEETRAKFYIAELILAIQHLHNNNIVYRDLKPENILLDANGHIALCDFGLSKANLTKNDTTNTFCGTTEYLAPEVLLDESGYTKMVDFWSLGVLVFEMCCGWSPFYAEDTQQMYKNIAFGKVRFPKETLSAEGRSFVKGLLNRNPKHRLGAIKDAAELMEHPFFRDIDWTALAKKLITPPFRPKLKSDTDVSYFDPIFTDAMDKSGSLNERAAALAQGLATSTPLSPSLQANFQGFTFVDESALDDNMRGRGSNNQFDDFDDDMHDATTRHRNNDQDWDDANDADARNSRMSGVVRNEEPMFGSGQMEI